MHVLEVERFRLLLTELRDRNFRLVGPRIGDGTIVLDEIEGIEDLPRGVTDRQEAGRYRLEPRDDQALFGYVVGPLARYNLNFDRLPPEVQAVAREAGLGRVCQNPVQSIIVRSVETLYAAMEALRILNEYSEPDTPAVPIELRAGTGYGCTEAPRGILYHRYVINEGGLVEAARIIPPTAQNLARAESDLLAFLRREGGRTDAELKTLCELIVRNYDPCISCATHLMDVRVTRD